jgi:phosphatidylglycerol:prolipoprotein diacylglycerol transferase
VVYSYATCIVLGALIAALYTKYKCRKRLGFEISNNFFYLLFIASFVGGKIFYYLEKPLFYFNNPSQMLDNFSGGFVFYGSFLFAIPFVIVYFKKIKQPVLPMLDILAITTLIVHAIGRIGCFFGGCCYGKPTNSFYGIVFKNSNNIAVYPTQLFEAFLLLAILTGLIFYKKHQKFNGQIFLFYLTLYASVRIILENLRGDARVYLFKGLLSQAQTIAIALIIISIVTFFTISKQKSFNT